MSNSARGAALAIAVLACAAAAAAEQPLSAIDWLSDSITEPVVAVQPEEPAVSAGPLPEEIVTTTLDGPRPDSAGLLPPSVTGLPARLWGPGESVEIARLIRAESVDTLPTGQALLATLLLAEAEPPAGATAEGALLLARVDKLLDLGLVEEAGALLERAGADSPELFRRAFDVALLLGAENGACESMRERPDVAPTFPARIFCLARGGDWTAAALTLGTTRALGQISEEEEALLSRFLDPDLYEEDGPLSRPARPTPLVFRMHEAVGEPLTSAGLPRAFAHADLRPTAGWKAQIEAAERLARTGAIDPNRLLAFYTERRAAASGGVWERVAAVQALESAVSAGDGDAVARVLPRAWRAMQSGGLLPALAGIYGDRLAPLAIRGEAAGMAFRLGLLSDGYEEIARAHTPADADEAVLSAVALGQTPARVRGMAGMALSGLEDGAAPSPTVTALLSEERLGEALLHALEDLATGYSGDPRRLAGALAAFRAVGLESTARRAALEYMILAEPA